MTALDQYQRLETTGHWLSGDTPPREVLVKFGKATLVLTSLEDEAPLAHWSIPAISILERAETGTTYALDTDASERLVLEDRDMRAALDLILGDKRADRPAPGSGTRWFWPGAAVAALAGLAWFFVPDLLTGLANRLIAPERAARLAEDMIPLIEARTGPRCTGYRNELSLDRIAERIDPGGRTELSVVDLGDIRVLGLPGRRVLIGRGLLERATSPEEIAGWVILAQSAAERNPAISALFSGETMDEGLRFLFSGELTDEALSTMTNRLLIDAAQGPSIAEEAIAARMKAVELASAPLQAGLKREGVAALLPETAGRPGILGDDAWVALQEICSN